MSSLRPGSPARGTTTGRPLLVLFDALGRRGALRVLWELRDDTRRPTFRALQAACETNPSALNTRLKELRGLDLVGHDGSGYHLTPHGRSLIRTLQPLNAWAEQWSSVSDVR